MAERNSLARGAPVVAHAKQIPFQLPRLLSPPCPSPTVYLSMASWTQLIKPASIQGQFLLDFSRDITSTDSHIEMYMADLLRTVPERSHSHGVQRLQDFLFSHVPEKAHDTLAATFQGLLIVRSSLAAHPRILPKDVPPSNSPTAYNAPTTHTHKPKDQQKEKFRARADPEFLAAGGGSR